MIAVEQYLSKLNRRTIILSSIVMFILIVMFANKVLFSPLYSSIKKANEELSSKSDMLMKYYAVIGNEELYREKLEELMDSYNVLENKFFQFSTEDLAQAKIQEFVKNIAKKNGIVVSRSSAKKGVTISEEPHLMLIYASFEISSVDKTEKLQSFLYDIEYEAEKHILIDDLKVRSTGFGISKGIYISITLSAIAAFGTENI